MNNSEAPTTSPDKVKMNEAQEVEDIRQDLLQLSKILRVIIDTKSDSLVKTQSASPLSPAGYRSQQNIPELTDHNQLIRLNNTLRFRLKRLLDSQSANQPQNVFEKKLPGIAYLTRRIFDTMARRDDAYYAKINTRFPYRSLSPELVNYLNATNAITEHLTWKNGKPSPTDYQALKDAMNVIQQNTQVHS